jgi:ABC-type nitrate/sulfonate/bicarbonate transport system substrate-binding protein
VAQKLVDQGLGRFIVDGWDRQAVLKLFGSDFQVNGLNVRNEFIEKHPEAVQAVVDVMLEGMKFLRDNAANPEAVLKVLAKPFQDLMREVDAATVIRRVSAGVSPDGCPSDMAAKAVQKSLEAANLLKSTQVDWSKYQTARFLHGACK